MKIGVIHYDLNACGGAEYVCVNMIEALNKAGHEVGLCINESVDFEKIRNFFGVNIKNSLSYVYTANSYTVPFFEIYRRMLYGYSVFKKFWRIFDPDLVVVSFFPLSVVPKKYVEKTMTYIQSFVIPIDFRSFREDETISNNLSSKIYLMPIRAMLRFFDEFRDTKLLANSKYTSRLIKERWGRNASVIYPPCPLYLDLPIKNKRDWVCTLSRFSREKRYETILEIAKETPDIEYHLMGSVSSDKIQYFSEVFKKGRSISNVNFHINASIDEKKEILQKSKVLLHANRGEHFGICLIEAMSSGTIPVPHNSGAARDDSLVSSRYRWKTVSDAAEIIKICMDDWNVDLANKLRDKSRDFDSRSFQRHFMNSINDEISN